MSVQRKQLFIGIVLVVGSVIFEGNNFYHRAFEKPQLKQ